MPSSRTSITRSRRRRPRRLRRPRRAASSAAQRREMRRQRRRAPCIASSSVSSGELVLVESSPARAFAPCFDEIVLVLVGAVRELVGDRPRVRPQPRDRPQQPAEDQREQAQRLDRLASAGGGACARSSRAARGRSRTPRSRSAGPGRARPRRARPRPCRARRRPGTTRARRSRPRRRPQRPSRECGAPTSVGPTHQSSGTRVGRHRGGGPCVGRGSWCGAVKRSLSQDSGNRRGSPMSRRSSWQFSTPPGRAGVGSPETCRTPNGLSRNARTVGVTVRTIQ